MDCTWYFQPFPGNIFNPGWFCQEGKNNLSQRKHTGRQRRGILLFYLQTSWCTYANTTTRQTTRAGTSSVPSTFLHKPNSRSSNVWSLQLCSPFLSSASNSSSLFRQTLAVTNVARRYVGKFSFLFLLIYFNLINAQQCAQCTFLVERFLVEAHIAVASMSQQQSVESEI